ncbi:Cas1p-domain-containing protein [Pholiota conissans]|uniref:Cas1p-domain-containing protein n=1 Tax=Pholiota conissans TaxID=109636 RepID=A0A9P6D2E0_9AGAR|nr:Cas1p-domain-containing protein [Pholiota conissans]
MLHAYTENDASTCLRSKDIIFIGDSVTRKLFFQVAQTLDKTLTLLSDDKKHSDHFLHTKSGSNVTFIWDPFLNSSYVENVLATSPLASSPALLVLGSGLWYLRYAVSSGGVPAWESKMEHVFKLLSKENLPADEVVILPIGQVVPSKLTKARAQTMRPAEIDAMNSDLYHRIYPPSDFSTAIFETSNSSTKQPHPLRGVSLPLVFNDMLDDSLTEDGLHYSDSVVTIQARILLNFRCNDILPKTFPMNKTCCNRYPTTSILQAMFLGTVILLGPVLAFRGIRAGSTRLTPVLLGKQALPVLIVSAAIALIFIADRTGFWLKEQKHFNAWAFGSLSLLSLFVGFLTVDKEEADKGFLNREQTDEWKGWMQVAILIYHYFGASKISGIYNPIRVLVASYLFMTGYGHTIFYIRKADYGFTRIAQVLIRLNLFTVLLSYTMNTDYISYYFTPLVSMWYIVVYITMFVGGSRVNDRVLLLVSKIFLSAGFMTWFMNESWLLEALFDILHRIFAIHWSAAEWAFRVNLDIWIVFIGMLTAVAATKIREHRITDHRWWPFAVKGSIGLSALVVAWFFAFELFQESKFTYNTWHPYISFLPVLSFVTLRNSSAILRSASSRAFVFVGKCSLEAFIIQYHIWLAGDSKGVLLIIPGTQRRPLNFILTTIIFFYVCDRVSYATIEITTTICGLRQRGLPAPVTAVLFSTPQLNDDDESEGQELTIPLMPLSESPSTSSAYKSGSEVNQHPIEPDTPIRPNRWIDRLAENSARPPKGRLAGWLYKHKWLWQLHAQVLVSLGILWLLNILWYYPPGVAF